MISSIELKDRSSEKTVVTDEDINNSWVEFIDKTHLDDLISYEMLELFRELFIKINSLR
jgi:hypothetical protein